MQLRPYVLAAVSFLALGIPPVSHAEDIDIYDGNNSASRTPNVLLVLDTGANFNANAASLTCTYEDDGGTPSLGNTTGGVEQCALYNTILALGTNADGSAKVNIGLMGFNHSSIASYYGCNTSGNGGCLLKPLTPMTAANMRDWLIWIRSWTNARIQASTDRTAASVQEAWAYYAGRTGLSGRNYADIRPVNSGCQSNYMVYIGNAWNNSGKPGDGGSADPAAALNVAPGITSAQKVAITIPSGKYGSDANPAMCGSYSMGNHIIGKGVFADEWTRYMYQTDLSGTYGGENIVISYTIGLLGPRCTAEYPALLSSMATYGGGKYFPTTDYTQLVASLKRIINEVQAVNSVFSSSSLPVSVNTQGTYLNQIYMGMFRPDKRGRPRWVGNLKQYQFKQDPNTRVINLADSKGQAAISSAGTGFIAPDAVSFWTVKNMDTAPDADGGFWRNDPQGSGLGFDLADGEIVEKGGAAQQLRIANLTNNYSTAAGTTTNPRKLYVYCPSGTACNAQLSDASNTFATSNTALTSGLLGVADANERISLINWVRGQDNVTNDSSEGAEQGPGETITVRPSIHGDVLHSRPIVVSYGGEPESVVVYYGTNDGLFRAVNGNQSTAIGSVPAGGEIWSLILPEFLGNLKRQRDNTPVIRLATTAVELDPEPKDYAVDGPTGLYQQLNADGTTQKAYIYLTMRRGGRFMYALDVTSPSAPKVLWKKSSSDSGMEELGQTWSRPRLALLKGYVDAATGKAKPVLIFGAGYSTTQDSEPPIADTMGRGIFILDAVTGALVWKATPGGDSTSCSGTDSAGACVVQGMKYSIAADISFLDRDGDGYVERLYAADLGGNIWRVDLEPTAGNTPQHWKINRFAALGCNAGACTSGVPRKFFFAPSVIPVGAAGTASAYDLVMVASGDREHPLYSTSDNSAYRVTNRLYFLKDRVTTKNNSASTSLTESNLQNATTGIDSYTASSTDQGFYITLAAGEKSVNAPLTVAGVTHFGTNQPTAPAVNSCSSGLGVARIWSVNIFTSARNTSILDGGGLPPSPVSGVVMIGDKKTGFCIGCGTPPGGQTPPEGTPPQSVCKSALDANCFTDTDGDKKIIRTYWYRR